MSFLRNFIRNAFIFFHIDITKNIKYDRLTKAIMKKIINENSNCIDVGCHKGEMLEDIIILSPTGNHFAFEPLPDFYKRLKEKFNNKTNIYPYALSDKAGKTTFKYVKNAPAYSGLKERKYDINNPDIEDIEVEVKTLDTVIPQNIKIDFIKIDVEGAEVGVLKGALNILRQYKPYIIFECGLGASEFYNTKPDELYDYLKNEADLNISLLKNFLNSSATLTKDAFITHYINNTEYYFIAHP